MKSIIKSRRFSLVLGYLVSIAKSCFILLILALLDPLNLASFPFCNF